MVQYQYFHTNRGYVYRLSIGRDSRDYLYLETLFQKIRSITEGNTFTYAALSSGNSMFMQSTSDEKAIFAKGLVCEDLSELPSKFIDQFETEAENPEMIGNTLPDGELPSVSRRTPEFPSDRIIHRFMPKLVDALINGEDKKQILIVTEDKAQAKAFMNALGAILPKQYLTRVGFCMGVKTLNSADIRIPRQNGETEEVSIKIWLPELMNYRFETYSSAYYVFDAKADRENYNKPLGSLSQVLSEISLNDTAQVNDLMRSVSAAFAENGSVNKQLLETLASIYLLGIKKDPETARKVLASSTGGDPTQKLAMVTSINVLLDPNNFMVVNSADISKIFELCGSYPEIQKEIQQKLIGYMAMSRDTYTKLSADAKAQFIRMLTYRDSYDNDQSGMLIDLMYDGWWKRSVDSLDREKTVYEAFTLTIEAIAARFKQMGAYHTQEVKNIVEKAVGFFDIDVDSYGINALADYAFNYQDADISKYAVALLMAPICSQKSNDRFAASRIELLKDKMNKRSARDTLNYIVVIRNYLVEIAEEIPALRLEGQHNFMFESGSSVGLNWCAELIGVKPGMKNPLSGSVSELLAFYNDTVRCGYTKISDLLTKQLLDVRYVESKIKAGSREHKEYERFIATLPSDMIDQDINILLQNLYSQGSRSNKNRDFRYLMALTRFAHLSEDRQMFIMQNVGVRSAAELETLSDKNKRLKFVAFIDHMYNPKIDKPSVINELPVGMSMLWSVIWSLISFVLLLVPGFVQYFADRTTGFIARLNTYASFWFIAGIPVLELIGLTMCYFLTKVWRNKGVRTMKIGMWINLPILVFVVVYLILFFSGISIPKIF